MSETTNIYGEIRSLDEFRDLFRQLRDEVAKAEDRNGLTEIKKRSEYLCTLADNPIWRDEYDRGGLKSLEVARAEDEELSKLLNERARNLITGGDAYRPWHEGDDSNATRNT